MKTVEKIAKCENYELCQAGSKSGIPKDIPKDTRVRQIYLTTFLERIIQRPVSPIGYAGITLADNHLPPSLPGHARNSESYTLPRALAFDSVQFQF